MDSKKYIGNLKKNALHDYLGMQPGTPIPMETLNRLTQPDKPPHVRKMAQFAKNARKFNH